MDPGYELLSRWALGVQLAAVALLAAFFVALTRTVRLQEVRLWAAAWVADAAALAAVGVATFFPLPLLAARLAASVYVAGKTAYVGLLVGGANHHLRPGASTPTRPRWLAAAALVWSLLLGMLSPALEYVRIAVCLMVGGVLTYGAVWVLRRPRMPRSRWLGFALLVEGLLFLHYVPLLLPRLWGAEPLARYTRYASFFDSGAELLVALAILVVVEASSSQHLEHLNRELLASQDRLRLLVDLDPLTSLANRRKLRDEMDRVRARGAAVMFLDVDNFKEINDRHGHIVGDACLLRVAAALTRIFRSDDALFRLGGDEFLVIAPGLDYEAADARVRQVRDELAAGDGDVPPVRLSVGVASLAPDGEPDAAIREADDRMYLEKRGRGGTERHRTSAIDATKVS